MLLDSHSRREKVGVGENRSLQQQLRPRLIPWGKLAYTVHMLSLMPLPASVVPRAGEFVLGPNSRVLLGDGAAAEARPAAEYLSDGLRGATGLPLPMSTCQQRR